MTFEDLMSDIEARTAPVGVIGLGYVGLPLAMACATAGFRTLGFDTDGDKPRLLNAGKSYVDAVSDDVLGRQIAESRFSATDDFNRLAECRIVIICVPTPLTAFREPDLTFVAAAASSIAESLRPGQLIVLESTSFPGTTREVLVPILQRSGMTSGRDFLVGYSPERENPGNRDYSTARIPKVVAGDGDEATRAVDAFYSAVVDATVPVSSTDVAEAVKITENVFRAVNIALANELKVVYDAMGIDVWEVIEAAATKPFGYMPFYPGPGLGGHCIPIDPFYLTWKAREFSVSTRFIELAGEINVAMPAHIVGRIADAMGARLGKSLHGSSVLLLGIAYKRDVADVRESPGLKLMELLEKHGAKTAFHDARLRVIPRTRQHAALAGRESVDLDAEDVATYDAVVLVTDHADTPYDLVADNANLIIDTRNAFERSGLRSEKIVKA